MAKATDFFPIPSSLFTKKPSPFHMGLYFQKVPTVNPSVKNQRFLPAPFGKGAFGVHRRSPPGQRGVVLPLAKPGGFSRLAGFHTGLYFGKVPTVNPSVKNQRFLPAPTGREPLRAVPAANFARQLSTNRYFPDPPGIGGLSAEPITYSLFPEKSGIGTAVQASFGDG